MTALNIYKTYSFRTKDPVIDQLRTMVKDSKMSYSAISHKSGVSTTTLYNWFHGKTRRPQSASIEATGRALGYQRTWVKIHNRKKD